MTNSQIFNRFSSNLLNLEIPIKTTQATRVYYPGQSLVHQGKSYAVKNKIETGQTVILIDGQALPQQPSSQKTTTEKVLLNRHTSKPKTYDSNTICPNVVWFKGGDGPPPPDPPEEIPENATGTLLSVRGTARRWFGSSCGGNQSVLQSITVPGYVPVQNFRETVSDGVNLCGFTTWTTTTIRNNANTVTIAVVTLGLPNWAGWISAPNASVASYLYDFPPPDPPTPEEEEEWLGDQTWQSVIYDVRISVSYADGILTVKDAEEDEIIDTIEIAVVQYQATCDPDNPPE